VVTGHDADGRAIVAIDEVANKTASHRTGQTSVLVWTTDGFPVNNSTADDGATRQVGITAATGTVFRIVELAPGVVRFPHRTNSVDYAVVISGEIEMELDDDVVRLRAGDVLVQRGTVHNWVNRNTSPCVMAFVLVAAAPVEVGGKSLAASHS
jgi:quercetin dioxygenase-like cupin family protein